MNTVALKNSDGSRTVVGVGDTVRLIRLFGNRVETVRQIRRDGMYFAVTGYKEPFWYNWNDIEVIEHASQR